MSRRLRNPDGTEMTVAWFLMVPLMLLAVAIATVPGIVALSKDQRDRRAIATFRDDVLRDLSTLDELVIGPGDRDR